MNLKSLSRYDISPDNRFIIDVMVPGPEELFEKFDENASFYKKDLNERFERYLLECVDEIGLKNKHVIRIGLPSDQEKKIDETDIGFSFKQYFDYSIYICEKELKSASFRMLLHIILAISSLVLMFAVNLPDNLPDLNTLVLLISGLPAAIWVLLLTGFSRYLFRSFTQRKQIKIYQTLKNTPVEFLYKARPKTDNVCE